MPALLCGLFCLAIAAQWMGPADLTGIVRAQDPDTASAVPMTAPDDDAMLIPDGPSVPVHLTTPGQMARYQFEGQQDQIISARLTDFRTNRCRLSLALLNPAGTRLAANAFCAGDLLVRQTLPADGTYTLVVSVDQRATAEAMLSLYTVQDEIETISPNGPSVLVHLTTPGQVARVSFTGGAGQIVTAQLSDLTVDRCRFSLVLLDPLDTRLATNAFCSGNLLPRQTLPVDGTYTVVVGLDERLTAQANLTLRTEQS